MNHETVEGPWRKQGLRVPQRRKRKRHGTSTASSTVIADRPDWVWATYFHFDVTTDGTRSRKC